MDCKNEEDNLDDREINDDDFNSVDDLLCLIYLEKKSEANLIMMFNNTAAMKNKWISSA